MERFCLIPIIGTLCIFSTNVFANNNCTGATYYDSDSGTCVACPTGYDYNTDAGKTDITQCQIHCDGGTYVVETPIETSIPASYTQLEYIESTGTQWISTNVAVPAEFELYLDGMITKFNYGDIVASTEAINVFLYSTTYLASGLNGSYSNGGIGYGGINKKFHIGLSSHWVLSASGKQHILERIYTPSGFLKFFANGASSQKASARIYKVELYDSGNLIFQAFPVQRKSDQKLGIYDTISGQFFTKSGTGDFIAGPDTNNQCVAVESGYWAAESTVNYGSIGTRNACPAGTYTVGYGHGADSLNDCSRILHVGDYILYGRRDKLTTPSINIQIPGEDAFYISLSPTNHNLSRLHLSYNGQTYTAYDDSLFYGERNLDTNEQISN